MTDKWVSVYTAADYLGVRPPFIYDLIRGANVKPGAPELPRRKRGRGMEVLQEATRDHALKWARRLPDALRTSAHQADQVNMPAARSGSAPAPAADYDDLIDYQYDFRELIEKLSAEIPAAPLAEIRKHSDDTLRDLLSARRAFLRDLGEIVPWRPERNEPTLPCVQKLIDEEQLQTFAKGKAEK